MVLTAILRSRDQRIDVQARRVPENGSRHLDGIIGGQSPDDIGRRLVAASELGGKPGAGGRFDLLGEAADDLSESPDFVFRVGAGDQDVGRMPQRARTTLGVPAGNRFLQFGQK